MRKANKFNNIAKKFSFVIVAGGSGSRLGGMRKQFRPLDGIPMWRWSAQMAMSMANEGIAEIVLVLPHDDISCPSLGSDLPHSAQSIPLRFAGGGASRAESVLSGLLAATCDYVMVHDAARPFANRELLRRLMYETTETVGVVPVLPVTEAIKRIDNTNNQIEAVDREKLFTTQTPQSFYRPALIEALSNVLTLKENSDSEHDMSAAATPKDEAEAWLAAGHELRCIEGERINFKVTWPEDMRIAEAIVEKRRAPNTRVGIGYDIHRLVPDRPLILGGVKIESSPLGLLGHSDADALTHAVADALLGAAGLPDIGELFPASDPNYEGADSLVLLEEVVDMVYSEGWRVSWVDAVIQAQVPRLSTWLPRMREKLSKVIKPEGPNCVGVKAKSAEEIGAAGMGLSMTCWAAATLYRGEDR